MLSWNVWRRAYLNMKRLMAMKSRLSLKVARLFAKMPRTRQSIKSQSANRGPAFLVLVGRKSRAANLPKPVF